MRSGVLFGLLYCFSVGCIGLSYYLVLEHYSTDDASFCDLGQYFSCSKVNKSEWAELFQVPIASWGFLWSLVFLCCVVLAQQSQGDYLAALVVWLSVGFAFVWYLVLGEYVLGAICLMCTVIHVLTVSSLAIAIVLYRRSRERSLAQLPALLWRLRYWIAAVLALHACAFAYYRAGFAADHSALCICATERDVKLFARGDDMQLKLQRQQLGSAFAKIRFIDCNAHAARCEKASFDGALLWTRGSAHAKQIFTPTQLAQFSQCNSH
jgi:uncharacterized membrane protein